MKSAGNVACRAARLIVTRPSSSGWRRQLRKFSEPDTDGRALLSAAMDDLGLSARAHDRILRVARTIADLEASAPVSAGHIAEAIGYRTLDRKLWQK